MNCSAQIRRLNTVGYVPPKERRRCGSCAQSVAQSGGNAYCRLHRAQVARGGCCQAFERREVVDA